MTNQQPDKYQSLYEGSIMSLTDMAAKQSQALGRVGRLRQALVGILRKNFSSSFAQIETALGCRLNETDDEIIIAYLEAYVSESARNDQSTTIKALKEALLATDINIEGDDMLVWVDQIHKYRLTQTTTKKKTGQVWGKQTETRTSPTESDPDPFYAEIPFEKADAVESASRIHANNLGDLFDSGIVREMQAGDLGSNKEQGTWSPSPVKPTETIDDFDDDDDLDDDDTISLDEKFDDNAADNAVVDKKVMTTAIKPELFSKAPSKKRKLARTSKAIAPDDTHTPSFENTNFQETDLTEQTSVAMHAAVRIPRPVFTRDLVSIAGNLETVEAWEKECEANTLNTTMRFIRPKNRHRDRGRLIVVEQAEDINTGDWWSQCVTKYRAGSLFELGVLLHSVGDEIVAFMLNSQTASFHLNTTKGLIGVIVVLSPRLEQEDYVSFEITNVIEKMLNERLTLISVLTTSGEKGSLETLVNFIKTQAATLSWQPTCPIVAARSWEYVEDRGSSATLILK
jgi:recombinational DNA repair protein RecR